MLLPIPSTLGDPRPPPSPPEDPSTQQRLASLPPGPPVPWPPHPSGCAEALCSHKDGDHAPPAAARTAPYGFAPHPQHRGSPWGITTPSCPICPIAVLRAGGGRRAAQGSAPFPGGHAASAPGWGCSAAQRPLADAAQGCGEGGVGPLLPGVGQQGLSQTPAGPTGRSWAINSAHCPRGDTQINLPLSAQLHEMRGDGSSEGGEQPSAQGTPWFLRTRAPNQFWRKDRKLWGNGLPGDDLPNCGGSLEMCAPETRPGCPFLPPALMVGLHLPR